MRTFLFTITLALIICCGCAQRPDINVWGFAEPEGGLIRTGIVLNPKADAGLELGYANVVEELLMVGAYVATEIGEAIEVDNPIPASYLPLKWVAQPYVGGQLCWVKTVDKESDFDKTGIFGGPIAGVKIVLSENILVVLEDQFRLAEGGADSLGNYEMDNVAMFGAVIKFPKGL